MAARSPSISCLSNYGKSKVRMTRLPIILQSCFADDFPIAVLTNVTNPTILMTEIRKYYISLERKIYMSVVLYEYSGFEFHISMLAAPFMSAIGIIFFIRPDLFYKINNINTVDIDSQKTAKQTMRFFLAVWTLVALTFSLMEFMSNYGMYRTVSVPYKSGSYSTVEGYVKNFDPMPVQGHKQESFTINGVKFSYTDFSTIQGYHNARSKGGVIRGNGQHLKIKYITYKNKNYIMYIEEIKQ